MDSVYKVATMPRNFEAEIVMEGSDVVRVTGGTVGVIGGAAETASGMGTSGAEVGDAGAGGIVFVGSLPCSVCEGTGGVTMGGAPGSAE